MNVCKGCRVPTIISRDQSWNDDGTVTLTSIADFRMVLLEVPLLNELAVRLEAISGPQVRDLMKEGSRRGAYNYALGLLKGPLKFVVRHTATGARIAYSKLMDSAWALGLGKIFMESYDHNVRLTGKVYNPFNLSLLTGIVHGSYEAIEGFASKSEWTDKGQFSEVNIWTDKGAPRIETLPEVIILPRVKGSIARDRCPTCRLPKEVARFRWRSEKGDIEDDKTKTRMVLIGLTDMGHVFKATERTTGARASEVIRAVNAEYGRNAVKNGWITSFDDLAMDLAAKGLGLISVKKEPKTTTISVLNHYQKEFIIGRCLGVHDALVGPGYTVKVKEDGPASMTVTFTK